MRNNDRGPGGPSKGALKNPLRRLAVATGLALLTLSALAVDPPPPSIAHASKEEQMQYVQKIGTASERLRSKVAKERFEQKRDVKRAFARGLTGELETQRVVMAAQSAAPDDSSDLATVHEAVGGKSFYLLFAAFGMMIFYHSRDKIYSWLDSRAEG